MSYKKSIVLIAVSLSSCALAMRDPELPTVVQISQATKVHIFEGKLVFKETEEVKPAYSYLNPFPSMTALLGYLTLKPAHIIKRSAYGVLEGYHAYCTPTPGQPDPAKTITDLTTPQDNGVFHIVWGQTYDGVYYTKKVGSTMYPLAWCQADTVEASEQNILDRIVQAYKKQEQVKKEGDRFVVVSCIDGVPIEVVAQIKDQAADVITAYALEANEYHPDTDQE